MTMGLAAAALSASVSAFDSHPEPKRDAVPQNIQKQNEKQIMKGAQARQTRSPRAKDMECIASAVWHEAGNQNREGRIAIAEVVIARAESGIYPKKPCAVIAQRRQFSFVHRGVIPAIPAEKRKEMMHIVKGVVAGRMSSRVKGALSFHADYVKPNWKAPVMGRIGNHIFYGQGV